MSINKIYLIVGLGNPGPQYENTRHNVGAILATHIASQYKLKWQFEAKFKAQITSFVLNNEKIWILLPTTYMNNSGEAVQPFIKFYKILPQNILVVHDELDFIPGVVKLKFNGGSAGHNGLKSIIQHIGAADFYRLRIGIGHPNDRNKVANYVLQNPTQSESHAIGQAMERALIAMPFLLQDNNLEKAKASLANF